jgi:AbrB family looped-hinge helix DNA binding protein
MEREDCRPFYGAVTVSDRGQIVIPAEARRDLGIEVGEKLLVMGSPGDAGGLLLLRANVVGRIISQWTDLIELLEEETLSETTTLEEMDEER